MTTQTIERSRAQDGPLTYFTSNQAIKATSENRIGGYLVVWGDRGRRDLQGEFFTKQSDLRLNMWPHKPVLFHHGLDSKVKGEVIGYIDSLKADEIGLWAEAILEDHNEYVRKVNELVEAGALAWSSGSLPQLVEVEEDGWIRCWPIAEGSLTPTPAEPRRTDVRSIKAAITKLTTANVSNMPEGSARTKAAAGGDASVMSRLQELRSKTMPKPYKAGELITALQENDVDADTILSVISALEEGTEEDMAGMAEDSEEELAAQAMDEDENKMDDEEYKAEGEESEDDTAGRSETSKSKAKQPAKKKPTAKSQDTRELDIRKIVLDAVEKSHKRAPAADDLPAMSGGGRKSMPRIEVRSKYADLSPQDSAFLMWARQKAYFKDGVFYRERELEGHLVETAQKAYKSGEMKLSPDAGKRLLAIKDNELNNTQVAADGADWVPELWSSDLWERMRVENEIAAQFQVVDMPSPTYDLPIESTDPTVYYVPETTNEAQLNLGDSDANPTPDSKIGTAKVQLVAKKLSVRGGFSSEVVEDSIIQFIPQVRNQQMRAMQDAIDHVLANGDDVTGTGNINLKGANTSTVPKVRWLAFDGIRKLALVDGTGLTVDMGGAAPTLQKIREARFKLLAAYALRPSDLVMFVDPSTYGKMLGIDELNVYFNNGQNATVNTGTVPMIDGIPTYPSAELSLTDTDGYYHSTAGSNTRGQILIVHKPSWKVGYRRRIQSAVEYLPYYDSYQMTHHVRIAFTRRDATCATMLLNLGV